MGIKLNKNPKLWSPYLVDCLQIVATYIHLYTTTTTTAIQSIISKAVQQNIRALRIQSVLYWLVLFRRSASENLCSVAGESCRFSSV